MADSETHFVHLDTYEGPLELLPATIQRKRVDIYDIPIAQITASYLEGLEPDIELDSMMGFYYPITALLLMKSRMLLPRSDNHDDPENYYKELVEHVIEYKRLKFLADLLDKRQHTDWWIERRDHEIKLDLEEQADMWTNIDIQMLQQAFDRILRTLTPQQVIDLQEETSVSEKTSLLLELLNAKDSLNFNELTARTGSVLEIVCALLAILEAARSGQIAILQQALFGDIVVHKRNDTRKKDHAARKRK